MHLRPVGRQLFRLSGAIVGLVFLTCGCSTTPVPTPKDAISSSVAPARESYEVAQPRYTAPPEFTHLDDYVSSELDEYYMLALGLTAVNGCLKPGRHKPLFELDMPDVQLMARGSFYGQPVEADVRAGGYARLDTTRPNLDHYYRVKKNDKDMTEDDYVDHVIGHYLDKSCHKRATRKFDAAYAESDQPGGESTFEAGVLVDELVQRSQKAAESDVDVRTAAGRWADCMSAAGFDVNTPEAQLRRTDWPSLQSEADQTALAREKETAVADAKCRARSGYLDAYITALNLEQARLINEHYSQIEVNSRTKREARTNRLKQLATQYIH